MNNFRRISALARLIILDGIRRQAVVALVFFALAGMAGGVFFFDFIPRDIGRASNDFLFSIIWLSGFIFLLFHSVQIIAWDNHRGSLHTFLARPISRAEYAIGVYLGLALLLLILNCILGLLAWSVLNFIKDSVNPLYFSNLSLANFLLAELGLYGIQLMILAVILLFSSLIRGSFPVLLLTLCYYFICTGIPVVRESIKSTTGNSQSRSLEITLKLLTTIFPDFSWLNFKGLVTAPELTPMATEVILPFGSAMLYITIALMAGCFIYQRRDL